MEDDDVDVCYVELKVCGVGLVGFVCLFLCYGFF